MHSTVMELDFIEEIRLRCWARENYVVADDRDDNWHPIVLEEMRKKDLEAARDDELIVQDALVVHDLVEHNDAT